MNNQTHNISLSVEISESHKAKIMALADDMAAACFDRGPQSYDTLMQSRTKLETYLNEKIDIYTKY